MRDYIFNWLTRKVPLSDILPFWVHCLHLLIFPLDTLGWWLSNNRPYKFEDTHIITRDKKYIFYHLVRKARLQKTGYKVAFTFTRIGTVLILEKTQ